MAPLEVEEGIFFVRAGSTSSAIDSSSCLMTTVPQEGQCSS